MSVLNIAFCLQLTVAGRYGLFDPDRTIKGDASQRITLSAQYNFIENGAISIFYWANLANADRGADDTIQDKGDTTPTPRDRPDYSDVAILVLKFFGRMPVCLDSLTA